jgi:hypothetical protein
VQVSALVELRGVLAPGGLLVVSSPNPDANVPGNPHHVRELTPSALERLLAPRWPVVKLLQQLDFEASAILPATEAANAPVDDVVVRRLQAQIAGTHPYTIAVAGEDLPDLGSLVMLTSSFEVREWVERFAEQQRVLHDQVDFITDLQRKLEDYEATRARLVESETARADILPLQERLKTAEAALHRLTEQLDQATQRADRAESVVRDLQASASWRVTVPLRRAKHLLGR